MQKDDEFTCPVRCWIEFDQRNLSRHYAADTPDRTFVHGLKQYFDLNFSPTTKKREFSHFVLCYDFQNNPMDIKKMLALILQDHGGMAIGVVVGGQREGSYFFFN